MDDPSALEFEPIPRLRLRGFFSQWKLSWKETKNCLWMKGSFPTFEKDRGEPLSIQFVTPYPVGLPSKWIISDFLCWLLTHEMLEGVHVVSRDSPTGYSHLDPLFAGERLQQDHDSWLLTPRHLQLRLSRIQQRFEKDYHHERWDQPSLRDTLRDGISSRLYAKP